MKKKPSTRSQDQLEEHLKALPDLPRDELKRRWSDLYGSPCPAHISRGLLTRAIAYRMQENVLGGLDRATQRRLERAAEELAAGRSLTAPGSKIKPGTRLLREWNGRVHEVIVLGRKVQYRDKIWPSLSAVAREITGTRWSGPRFFSLLKGGPK